MANVEVNVEEIQPINKLDEVQVPVFVMKGDKGDQGAQGEQGVQGVQGIQGPTGKDFSIYKTYASIAAMEADKANVEEGNFVLIASTTEDPDNAKLYVKGATDFTFLSDLSGAQGMKGEQGIQGIQGEQGIQGPTGPTGPANTLSIGTVASGSTAAATITGTAPNQTLNLTLPKGDKGDKGDTGNTGATGPSGLGALTLSTTDIGEGVTLAANTLYGVYE